MVEILFSLNIWTSWVSGDWRNSLCMEIITHHTGVHQFPPSWGIWNSMISIAWACHPTGSGTDLIAYTICMFSTLNKVDGSIKSCMPPTRFIWSCIIETTLEEHYSPLCHSGKVRVLLQQHCNTSTTSGKLQKLMKSQTTMCCLTKPHLPSSSANFIALAMSLRPIPLLLKFWFTQTLAKYAAESVFPETAGMSDNHSVSFWAEQTI